MAQTWEDDNEPATRPQLDGTLGKEKLPVFRALTLESCKHRARGAERNEVARNSGRNAALPDCRIGAPAKINVLRWKNGFVEGSSDRRRKDVGIFEGIAFRVVVEHVEERIEVVRVLIDMNHYYWSIGTNAAAQAPDGRSHGSQRVLSL